MKASKYFFFITILFILAGITAIGCSALTPKPAGLSAEEVSGNVENLLTAINNSDYDAFTRDFDEKMSEVFTEAEFTKIQDMLQETSGNYNSCDEAKLLNQGELAIYQFPCSFEKEDVTVTTIYDVGGTKISGLYFDSPNLRDFSQ